jgi:hypothetical protein
MRFLVTRTSQDGNDYSPCPEANRGKIAVWDRRTYKSPEEHDDEWGHKEKWHDRGTDHGFWYKEIDIIGGIKRRLPDRDCWYIDLSSIEELIAFMNRHGSIILDREMDDETYGIEIYDDYRE